jgi:hypothetical protein
MTTAKEYSRWDEAVVEAQRRGCMIVLPREDELFIDIDREEDLAWFERAVWKLAETRSILWEVHPSPSGEPGHYHAVVVFYAQHEPALDPMERIALQAALGSDRMRELLSIDRIACSEKEPTLFFETPERTAKIEATRNARDEGGWDDPIPDVDVGSIVRRPHKIWWVTFTNGLKAACFEGTESEVREYAGKHAAMRFGTIEKVETLPYPRDPRMGPSIIEDLPALCYGHPGECAGHTACPMGRACSE